MRIMNLLLAATLLFLNSESILAHGTETRGEIKLSGETVIKAGEVTLSFKFYDKKEKRNLADTDLAIVHEKTLHVFIFDEALI